MKDLEIKPNSIKEFQEYINELYGESNQRRPLEYVYSYLFRNVAYLSRVIGEQRDPISNFIKSFSWLFALSSKLEIDVEDAFLRKYPEICPYCLVKPCACIKTGKKPVDYIPEWKAAEEISHMYGMYRAKYKKIPIDDSIDKINDLYPSNKHIWSAAGPTFQFYRILEELGEIHEAYTSFLKGTRKIENIGEEIADVFAWLLSTWGICFPGRSLSDEFIGYYYRGCPVCNSVKCTCPDHNDRGERLVEIHQLQEFKKKIEELLAIAPMYKDRLDNIILSLDTVSETKSTTGAIRTVNQATEVLAEIESGLSSVDKSAKSIKSILSSVSLLIDSFPWS